MAQMNSRIERQKQGKTHLQKNDERYTPRSVVDYFGAFDYDPATTKEKAKEFEIADFDTIETDGLASDWTKYKRIWINPPFTRKRDFLEKAVKTYSLVESEIYFLCPIEYLTTAEFYNTIKGCCIYIPTGRISFENGMKDGKNGRSPAFGTVIVKLIEPDKKEVKFIDIKMLRATSSKTKGVERE